MKSWLYRGEEYAPSDLDPKKVYGFVYIIRDLVTGRFYIGKKFFWRKTARVVKGKKKKILLEGDWKTYWGSNTKLIADVKEHGEERFEKEILHICKMKAECGYLELKEQIDREVLLRDDCYNEWVSFKATRIHLTQMRAARNATL